MKDKIIQYYENTRQYYGAYHNHKEVCAWAGLALYILFAGLVNWMRLPANFKIIIVIILTLFVIAVSICVYRYISTQIKMKDLAAAYAATSFVFLSELISGEKNEGELKQYIEIEESPDTSAKSIHHLSILFLKKSEILNTRGRGFQDTTGYMIYGILILVTILILIVKWGQALG